MSSTFRLYLKITAGLLFAGCLFLVVVTRQESELKPDDYTKHYHQALPADREFYETAFAFSSSTAGVKGEVLAAIAPHHLLAADLIADLYDKLSAQTVDTVVLIGPNHFLAGQSELISSNRDWQTPYGVLQCDQTMLADLQKQNLGLNLEPSVVSS